MTQIPRKNPPHRSPRSAARQRWLADYKAFTYAKRTILELDSSYSGPAPRSTDIPAALRELEARMIAAADPEGRE